MGNVESDSLYHGLEWPTGEEVGALEAPRAGDIQVAIDRAQCIGSGPCFVLAPHAFALDDMMKAVVLDPAAESLETLLEAARECPTQAIYISGDGRPLYP